MIPKHLHLRLTVFSFFILGLSVFTQAANSYFTERSGTWYDQNNQGETPPEKVVLSTNSLMYNVIINDASLECNYVTNYTTKTAIPCDFPVFIDTGNPAEDKSTFQSAVSQWNSSNPTLTAVSAMPEPVANGTFIEIPEAEFELYATSRQAAVLRISYYYIITP
jgi:hypothetical protein